MQKFNFLKTTDKNTAEKLRKLGYIEISEESTKEYCFINESDKMVFADDKNIIYTNLLCL